MSSRLTRLNTSLLSKMLTVIFYGLIVAIIYDGWAHRDDALINAESGLGYALGIIGGSLMLIMLLYSLRKRIRLMRKMGKIRIWFRMHMLFGVLGPTLILYHANFQLGSMNSTVALFCMLLVAISGLIGRYIYTHIHYGLYGRKATVLELRDENNAIMQLINAEVPFSTELVERLKVLEQKVFQHPSTPIHAAIRHFTIGVKLFFANRKLRQFAKESLRERYTNKEMQREEINYSYRLAKHYIKSYISRLHKVSEIGFYERLFSLWHIVHVPFFIMMLLSGIIHVVAVHLY